MVRAARIPSHASCQVFVITRGNSEVRRVGFFRNLVPTSMPRHIEKDSNCEQQFSKHSAIGSSPTHRGFGRPRMWMNAFFNNLLRVTRVRRLSFWLPGFLGLGDGRRGPAHVHHERGITMIFRDDGADGFILPGALDVLLGVRGSRDLLVPAPGPSFLIVHLSFDEISESSHVLLQLFDCGV